MKSASFKSMTRVLGAPNGWDAEKHGPCNGLPVAVINNVCASCWELTWRERLKILFGHRV